jgi:hypothetical protein
MTRDTDHSVMPGVRYLAGSLSAPGAAREQGQAATIA